MTQLVVKNEGGQLEDSVLCQVPYGLQQTLR